jgi:hypothetical protein
VAIDLHQVTVQTFAVHASREVMKVLTFTRAAAQLLGPPASPAVLEYN